MTENLVDRLRVYSKDLYDRGNRGDPERLLTEAADKIVQQREYIAQQERRITAAHQEIERLYAGDIGDVIERHVAAERTAIIPLVRYYVSKWEDLGVLYRKKCLVDVLTEVINARSKK
jgi:hypothetical protein